MPLAPFSPIIAGWSFTMTTPGLMWTLYGASAIVCGAALWPNSRLNRRIHAAASAFARVGQRRRLAASLLFISVFAVRLTLLPFLPVPTPGIHDEFGYLLQADTFCHGRLANPTHPMWRSFETFHVNFFPTYASMYPPAQGAFLAVGELVGQPWFGVLVSDALMCAAIYWALCAWIPPRWAFLAGWLAALKLCVTTYWINGFWGGAAGAIGGALALGALGRILRRPSVNSAIVLGMGIILLANSRPLEGLIFCVPMAAVFLWWLAGKIRAAAGTPKARLQKVLIPVLLLTAANLAFIGYYNWRLTGNPYEFPEQMNLQQFDVGSIFLWQEPEPPREYNNEQFEDFYNRWERELYNRTWPGFKEVMATKIDRLWVTFAWWSLLCAIPGTLYVFHRKSLRLPVVCLLFVVAIVFVLTWSFPHYFAPATVVFYGCAAMAVRGTRHWRPYKLPVGAVLARLVFVGLLLQVAAMALAGNADALQWGGVRLPGRVAIQKRLDVTPGKHLVLVRYSEEHSPHDEWVYNLAGIDGSKVIWARFLDAQQNRRLQAYYRDRRFWVVEADDNPPVIRPYALPGQLSPEGTALTSLPFSEAKQRNASAVRLSRTLVRGKAARVPSN